VGERKTREGVVVSDAMQKTRVVKIERVYRHPRYQRVIRMSKRLKAHDERNESRVGDRVVIEETRPLSKEKRWRIRSILAKGNAMVAPTGARASALPTDADTAAETAAASTGAAS
jgi:small subunit ribosomal protein S17